ncbi:MAG TPA: helix-turn-helix transcriptional regulator [Solirubrobacterales bacterium]
MRGTRLKDLREGRRRTQQDVAEAVGVHVSRVGAWERGEGLYKSSVNRLAEFFGVDPGWLETGEGNPEPAAANGDFLDGLHQLEKRVDRVDQLLDDLSNALAEDRRWQQVEDRLNFLSEQMRNYAVQAIDEDEVGGSPKWSPIDLTPGEPKP